MSDNTTRNGIPKDEEILPKYCYFVEARPMGDITNYRHHVHYTDKFVESGEFTMELRCRTFKEACWRIWEKMLIGDEEDAGIALSKAMEARKIWKET